MASRVYVLYDGMGEHLDSCRASSEDEAWDYFADSWDVNDEGLYIEEDVDE